MKYYLIKNKEMPWGDYGSILYKGFLNVMDKNFNDLEVPIIERTGPYIPDIYIANSKDIVVSEKVIEIFKKNKVKGIFKLKKTLYKKLVFIDWENWKNVDNPEFYPESDEPENYILKGKDDLKLKKKSKKLYHLIPSEKKVLKIVSENKDLKNYSHLQINDNFEEDILVSGLRIIVSENFKEIIENNNIENLRFIELKSTKTES